ncbi:unnamed protein product [Camellia sinensis]
MEDSVNDQSSAAANAWRSSSILRYPLRSATKSKEEKPPAAELSTSAHKRGLGGVCWSPFKESGLSEVFQNWYTV